MITNNLISVASFTPKSLRSPNSWVGHLPFAAWVIQEIKPKIFVELGTHTGNSYFAFCQSVYENNLATKCFAVDTWQGDEHAGHYSDDVFEMVNGINEENYKDFSCLLRMTFEEALRNFEDESIDLLHIDGLHTYEAVRHDFESWLPKLAPGALVLFHDSNVHERDFGVWQLWRELKESYQNNLEFMHSYGLGVLQLNNAPIDTKLEWLIPNSPKKKVLMNYFNELGSRQLERYDLNFWYKPNIANLTQTIAEREAQVVSLGQTIAEREAQVVSLGQTIAEREAQVVSLGQTIEQLRTSISWRITLPLRFLSTKLRRLLG